MSPDVTPNPTVSSSPRPSGRGAADSGSGKPDKDTTKPPPPNPLAALVASRRAELGLSLRALQERSGVHYSHVSKLESGDDGAGVSALAGLSHGLELPLSELLAKAGVSANLGLPSFSGYLDAVVPELDAKQRVELEITFETLTGLDASNIPPGVSGGPS